MGSEVEDMSGSDDKYGKKHSFDPEFRGPIKSRGCTDVLCLLLLLAFIGGWGFIAVMAFQWGNPLILIYPSNSKGEICGKDNADVGHDLTNKPYLLFFDITKCLSLNAVTGCATPQVSVFNSNAN